jgi:ATP-dependent protease ClpP protease subunit
MFRISQKNFIKELDLHRFGKSFDYDTYNNIYFKCDVTQKNIQKLIRVIDEMNKCKLIKLHITSMGGDIEHGLLAYDIIKSSKIPIHTFCEGNIYSAGTLLYIGGKKRYITPHSKLLIHQLTNTYEGIYTQLKDQMYNDTLYMNELTKLYMDNSNLSKKTIEKYLLCDKLLTSQQCIEFGFSHVIL